jgi:hypothetical protein
MIVMGIIFCPLLSAFDMLGDNILDDRIKGYVKIFIFSGCALTVFMVAINAIYFVINVNA